MKIGAKNVETGIVKEIKKGTIMGLVKVQIPKETELSSVMTLESLEGLDIKKGDKVKVIFKAISVILIKE